MSLNIKNAETVALAEEVARLSGATKTATIRDALKLLRARLLEERAVVPGTAERLMGIAARVQALPDLGEMTTDDLYDEQGLWK